VTASQSGISPATQQPGAKYLQAPPWPLQQVSHTSIYCVLRTVHGLGRRMQAYLFHRYRGAQGSLCAHYILEETVGVASVSLGLT